MLRNRSLSRRELKQRVHEMQLSTPSTLPTTAVARRGPRAVAGFVAIFMILSVGGWWLIGRLVQPVPEVLVVSNSPTANTESWKSVVEELDRMRFRAFEARDLSALTLAVEPSSPAFARDLQALKEMIASDVEVTGLSTQVLVADEMFKRWSDGREFVALRVKDVRSIYETTIDGSESGRVQERPAAWWIVTLARSNESEAWRVWNVEASE